MKSWLGGRIKVIGDKGKKSIKNAGKRQALKQKPLGMSATADPIFRWITGGRYATCRMEDLIW